MGTITNNYVKNQKKEENVRPEGFYILRDKSIGTINMGHWTGSNWFLISDIRSYRDGVEEQYEIAPYPISIPTFKKVGTK